MISLHGRFGPWWNCSGRSINSKAIYDPWRRHIGQVSPKISSVSVDELYNAVYITPSFGQVRLLHFAKSKVAKCMVAPCKWNGKELNYDNSWFMIYDNSMIKQVWVFGMKFQGWSVRRSVFTQHWDVLCSLQMNAHKCYKVAQRTEQVKN